MGGQIGVGFVGAGRIADLHAIEYLQNPQARIVALCDSNPEVAQRRAEQWQLPGDAVAGKLDELLDRPDVDLVEILLPHHLHLEAGRKALAAGKIVSLQKPMGLTLAEADELAAAAASAEKQFRVFENFIFYPPVAHAKRLIDGGAIGDPLAIRIKSNVGTSRTAWEVPASATAWRQQAGLCGGGPLVFDDGHHKFALAIHFMGNPSAVHAFIGRTEAADGSWLDAQAIISLSFPENRIGSIEIVYSPQLEIDTRHYPQDDRIEITGTAGVLWINGGHGRLGNVAPMQLHRDGKTEEWRGIETRWEQSFVLATRHFLDALAEGSDPLLTARQARDVLQCALAAEESARTGVPVRLPSQP